MKRAPLFALALMLTAGFAAAKAEDAAIAELPGWVIAQGLAIPISGAGVREILWWDLYRIAIYLPEGKRPDDRFSEAAMPRCIHLQLLMEGPPPDRVPGKWQEKLQPVLSQEDYDLVIANYRKLYRGDTMTVAFNGTVTEARFNEEPFLTLDGPALVDAFLDLYLGDDPVSDSLKEDLLVQLPVPPRPAHAGSYEG